MEDNLRSDPVDGDAQSIAGPTASEYAPPLVEDVDTADNPAVTPAGVVPPHSY